MRIVVYETNEVVAVSCSQSRWFFFSEGAFGRICIDSNFISFHVWQAVFFFVSLKSDNVFHLYPPLSVLFHICLRYCL